jgi:very-short-patch-repair endonuclease
MSRPEHDAPFNEGQFRQILRRQHGLITAEQARSVGLLKDALARRVHRGELVRVLPRVYRSTLVPASLYETGLAAVLWAGDGAVASHVTAARIFGADLPEGNAHIWVPPGRNPKSRLVVVHRGEVVRNDRRIRERVSVTSPARTLVDLAGLVDDETLEAVAEDFFHRGVTTPLAVQRCLDNAGGTGRPGSHHLRALLADRDEAPLERKLEQKIWRLLRKAGLRPVRQHGVRCGTKKYRLDFAWPIVKVAVEGQGFAAHGGRLAHARDNRRLADLVAAGWRVIPVTWESASHDPHGVVERVRSALVAAA